jgi:carboxymethylenebutenolidase
MENKENFIDLPIPDSAQMVTYVAFPNIENVVPAIIILPEAFGVNDHICRVADQFAANGYTVIVPELFHRSAPKYWQGDYNDFQSFMPHYTAVTNEGLLLDLEACYKWLIERHFVDKERIFSIGYSFGGRVSFLANAVLPLKAAVSYYGGGTDELADRAKNLHGRHLFFWAGLDKRIRNENIKPIIDALDANGKDYINVKMSYVDHGFNRDGYQSYNQMAADDAMALTFAFLKNSN